jgi:hypothetical protein
MFVTIPAVRQAILKLCIGAFPTLYAYALYDGLCPTPAFCYDSRERKRCAGASHLLDYSWVVTKRKMVL